MSEITHTRTFPQEDISTEVFCLSIADMSPLSLSLSPSEVQNTREQREKLRGRREGGRGERERDRWKERKQERMKMSDLMLLSACQDF